MSVVMQADRAMVDVVVTEHALERGRERLGLKREAVRRMAQRVWDRAPLTRASLDLQDAYPDRVHKIYAGYCWVYRWDRGVWKLVTITPPRGRGRVADLDAAAKRARKEKMGRRLSWRA